METTEYRGYRIKATSREGEPRVWQARWTAVRLSGSGAHSKSGSVRGPFTGEREADEAALGEARAWVDQHGRQERLRRALSVARATGGGSPMFKLGNRDHRGCDRAALRPVIGSTASARRPE